MIKQFSKYVLILTVLVVTSCSQTVYKTRLVCSPDNYPIHTRDQQVELIKELDSIGNNSMVVLYLGEYMTLQKQIDKCNEQTHNTVESVRQPIK